MEVVSIDDPGARVDQAERRAAMARRLEATQDLLLEVDRALEAAAARTGRAVDPDGLLRAAARALVPVAVRNPGAQLSVDAGPGHAVALRVQHRDGVLRVEAVEAVAAFATAAPTAAAPTAATPTAAAPSAAGPGRPMVTELASMLWAGTLTAPLDNSATPTPTQEVRPS